MDIKKAINEVFKFQESEWILVDGYKGTNSDMTCRGYQYELNKRFEVEPGTEIKECESGFHLCLALESVFGYYNIGYGNRFFKVKALVRKNDYETLLERPIDHLAGARRDKLVARSITFIEEVPMAELIEAARKTFRNSASKEIPDKYIEMALKTNLTKASNAYIKDTLIEDGYSEAFSIFLVENMANRFELAHALASLEDLSMDVKIMSIMGLAIHDYQAYRRRR